MSFHPVSDALSSMHQIAITGELVVEVVI